MPSGQICVGTIIGVHGVRGDLKIKAYTDNPAALGSYGPVSLGNGRVLNLRVKTVTPKGPVIVSAREVDDRNAAELLRGIDLFVNREMLPSVDEAELYHADLMGLSARTQDGQTLGTITGIHDFGAGEIVEVKPPDGATMVLPFMTEFRDEVELEAGYVVLRPPAGMLEMVQSDGEADSPLKSGLVKSGSVKRDSVKPGRVKKDKGTE